MQKSYDKGEEVFNRLWKQEQRERLLTCPQVMWTKKRQLALKQGMPSNSSLELLEMLWQMYSFFLCSTSAIICLSPSWVNNVTSVVFLTCGNCGLFVFMFGILLKNKGLLLLEKNEVQSECPGQGKRTIKMLWATAARSIAWTGSATWGLGAGSRTQKDLRRWVQGKAKLAPVPACRGSGYPSNMKACVMRRKAFSTVWAPACLPFPKNPHQGRQTRGFKIFLWECTKHIYVL